MAGFPYMEAEIEYACKHEMAMTVKDMLTLRMRLAYINSEAAKQAIPRVAELMAQHLKWDKKEKERQIKDAKQYIGYFGGPVANKANAKMRQATVTDLHEVFAELDKPGSGYMDIDGVSAQAHPLGARKGSRVGPVPPATRSPRPLRVAAEHGVDQAGLPLPQQRRAQGEVRRDRHQRQGPHHRARVH